MKQRDLLFAGLLLLAAPAFGQQQPTFDEEKDAKVIFTQNFEAGWEEWSTTGVDTIYTLEYYDHAGSENGTSFKPWSDPQNWQKVEVARDSLIILKNGVLTTDDPTEIANNSWPAEDFGTEFDPDTDDSRRTAMAYFGEDGGDYILHYHSDTCYLEAQSWDTYKGGYTANYRRNLFVRDLPIEENTSYRLTFYVKANNFKVNSNNSPRMSAGVFRGYFHSEKPFSMGLESDDANYKYNANFEYTKDDFTGDWEKVTYMTYYTTDSVAENYVFVDGYWWAGGDWTWASSDSVGSTNPRNYDLNYIVQPDKYFVRLGFLSDYTDYFVDNLSLTKSWIAGCEYYNDKIRVDFGYKTNLGELADAAYEENKIAAVEVKDQSLFEVWGERANGTWQKLPIASAEYHGDGYMYMFTAKIGNNKILLNDYPKVLVTFHNPTDPKLELKYTGTGASAVEGFPMALDTAWIKAGKRVPDFYNEIATPNPTASIWEDVYSMKELPPVCQRFDLEEGSFGLDPATTELKFKFSRPVMIDANYNAGTENLIAWVNNELWTPSFNPADSMLTITRPAGLDPLDGDYEVRLLQIRDDGTKFGEDVVAHYNFGPITRKFDSQLVKKSDWRSEIVENTWDRPMPGSLYTYNETDGFYGGDGHNYSPYKKNGLYKMNDDGVHGDCFFYFTSRVNNKYGYLWATEDLKAGNYVISFPAFGWDRTSLTTELYVYPKPDEMTKDALIGAIKTKIGEIKPSKSTSWSDNNESRDWIADVETFDLTFSIPADGDYVIEWRVNKDGSQSYYGVAVGNYTISTAGNLSYSSTTALNLSVDAAKAQYALAGDNTDLYSGDAYSTLGTKIAYYDYDPEGEFTSTKPSDWKTAKKDLDDATAALKTRMELADKFDAEKDKVSEKLTETEDDYSALAVWSTLNETSQFVNSVVVPGATSDSLTALIDKCEADLKAFEGRLANVQAYENALDAVQTLIDDAEAPAYQEFTDMLNTVESLDNFNKIEASDELLAEKTAALKAVSKAYRSRINAANVLPTRIKALAALAEDLGMALDDEVAARVAEVETDDDLLADVLKSAIKIELYTEIEEQELVSDDDSLVITPFIKNYHLYTTASLGRTANSGELDESKEVNVYSIQTGWGWPAEYTDYAIATRGVEYETTFPGWTFKSFGGQNYIGQEKVDWTSDNHLNVFDAWLASDWSSQAVITQELIDLPVGQYTLGAALTYNEDAGNNTTLNATVKNVDKAAKTYSVNASAKQDARSENANAFIDSILIADQDTMVVNVDVPSHNSWVRLDNFFLAFRPVEGVDYTDLLDAEADKYDELYTQLTTFVNVIKAAKKGVKYFDINGVEQNAPKAGLNIQVVDGVATKIFIK